MVLVLHFCFGQRGAVMDAPINRPQSFVDKILLEKREECLHDRRLILRRHGRIRLVPLSKYANSLELLALQVQKLLCILPAFQPYIGGIHLELLAAQLLVYFDLDRQSVAIPPGHVRRVKSRHRLGFDDEVF